MKSIFHIIFIFSVYSVFSQASDTLSLDICQQLARENYPLIKQKKLLDEASVLKIKNISTSYFPQITLNGQATYQSDVTEIPQISPLFNFPSLSKDQYKLSLDVSQMIWDGGVASAQKKLEKTSTQADIKSVDVEYEKIKDRINNIYFSILLAQQQKKIILHMQEELKSKLKKIESGVKNETMLQSNADVLKAEIIKTEQQLIEIENSTKASLNMLSQFINRPLDEKTFFAIPTTQADVLIYENKRPEMELLDVQLSKLDALKKMSDTKLMPRIYAFAQGGYGRPGFNMLSNDFDFYYIAGAKITWNISAFYQSGREKQILNIQKDIVANQKEVFDKNLRISVEKNFSEIQKFRQLIEKDKEIIALRENITKTASIQLDNGVITSTEYITELNSEMIARLSLELHQLQLKLAETELLTTMGKQ